MRKMIDKMVGVLGLGIEQEQILETTNKTEQELLMESYGNAKVRWELAMQNYNNATGDYIDVAIIELEAARLRLDNIIKEIKTVYKS